MRLLALMFVLVLAGCGPQLETTYEIVPPVNIEGRQCANECLNVKQQCEQSCRSEASDCENVNLIEAQAKYIVYQSQNNNPDKMPQDFRGSRNCSPDSCMASCNANYNICHTNCGGKIIPHTQCVAFCE